MKNGINYQVEHQQTTFKDVLVALRDVAVFCVFGIAFIAVCCAAAGTSF